MPIDFFAVQCNNSRGNCNDEVIKCLQIIPYNYFGISDVDGGKSVPAKINGVDPNPATDFIVRNNSNTEVTFKAVDWCVEIYRTGTYSLDNDSRDVANFSSDSVDTFDSGLIKRCEGFLQFNDTIVFIEIKNISKAGGGWLNDAREKFEETILSFREHHPEMAAKLGKPILVNPSFYGIYHQNEMIQKKTLKNKIGLDFIRQNALVI